MDRGGWWATVHGVTKSWTQLKCLSKQYSTWEAGSEKYIPSKAKKNKGKRNTIFFLFSQFSLKKIQVCLISLRIITPLSNSEILNMMFVCLFFSCVCVCVCGFASQIVSAFSQQQVHLSSGVKLKHFFKQRKYSKYNRGLHN